MNFMNFDFIFQFYLLQCKKICTLKLIVALNFLLLRHDICLHGFFPSFKVDLHSTKVSRATDTIRWHMVFFQSQFELNEMFCLPNKFVLFTKMCSTK